MAFEPVNYAGIAPIGAPGLRDAFSSLMQGYEQARRPAQIEQQLRTEALRQKLLEAQAKYAPQEAASRLALRQAQLGAANTAARKAQMEMARMQAFSDLLKQRHEPSTGGDMGAQAPPVGGSPIGSGMGGAPMRLDAQEQDMGVRDAGGMAGAPQGLQDGQMPGADETEPSQKGQETGMQSYTIPGNPALAHIDELYKNHPEFQDMFKKQFGLGAPSVHQDPQSGQVFAQRQLPSGAVEVRAIRAGRQPEQIELAKDIAKADAEEYKETNKQIQSLDQLGNNLDFMIDTVNKNAPNAKDVIGPWNSVLTRLWTGDPQQLELLGQISSSTGNILLEAAKQLKGATTGRQMSAINAVKPNVQDRFPVFLGKLRAMKILQEFQQRQATLRNRYIRQGVPASEASERVRKELSFDPIQKRIDGLLKSAKQQAMMQEKMQQGTPHAPRTMQIEGKNYIQRNGKWYEVAG